MQAYFLSPVPLVNFISRPAMIAKLAGPAASKHGQNWHQHKCIRCGCHGIRICCQAGGSRNRATQPHPPPPPPPSPPPSPCGPSPLPTLKFLCSVCLRGLSQFWHQHTQHWQLATDADDQHLGVSVAGQLTQSRSTVHFVQLPIKNCRALARGRVRPHFLTPEASHD